MAELDVRQPANGHRSCRLETTCFVLATFHGISFARACFKATSTDLYQL
jgi:hypothetical protein